MKHSSIVIQYKLWLNSNFLRFINLILYSVFDFLQQTIDSSYNIQLLLILFFLFLTVHHVLCHFQRLSGFASINTMKNLIGRFQRENPSKCSNKQKPTKDFNNKSQKQQSQLQYLYQQQEPPSRQAGMVIMTTSPFNQPPLLTNPPINQSPLFINPPINHHLLNSKKTSWQWNTH